MMPRHPVNASQPLLAASRLALCLALALLTLALAPVPEARAGAFDQLKSMSGGGGNVPPVSGPVCVSGCGGGGGGSSEGSGGTNDDGERRPGGIFGLIDYWGERINAAIEESRAKARAEAQRQNQQGVAEYNRRNYVEAARLFRKACDNDPDNKVMAQNLKNAEAELKKAEAERKRLDEYVRQRAVYAGRMRELVKILPAPMLKLEGPGAQRPAVPSPGFTPAAWQEYLEATETAARLYAKRNKDGTLGSPDDTIFYEALQKRNALWEEAARQPQDQQTRQWSRLPLPVSASKARPKPEQVTRQVEETSFRTRLKNEGLSNKLLADYASETVQKLCESAVGEAVKRARGKVMGELYEHFLGIGHVAVAASEDGAAGAGAEAVDLTLSKIPKPVGNRAEVAKEGGRLYSRYSYRAMGKFMDETSKVTGVPADHEALRESYEKDFNTGQKVVEKWTRHGE